MPTYTIKFLDREQSVRAKIDIEYAEDAEVIGEVLKVDVLSTDFGFEIWEGVRVLYKHQR